MTARDAKNPRRRRALGWRWCWCLAAALALSSGCATRHDAAAGAKYDPWESLNRPVFAFSEALDGVVLKPPAKLYDAAMPGVARDRVGHFFANLEEPSNIANNLLQGRPSRAGLDLARLLVNSTFGVLGLFDVAGALGVERSREDFGQTLERWGVAAGPYVFVPLFGPHRVRELAAKPLDILADPVTYVESGARLALILVRAIDDRAGVLPTEEALRSSGADLYAAVRDYYIAKRRRMEDGEPPPMEDEAPIDLYDAALEEATQAEEDSE